MSDSEPVNESLADLALDPDQLLTAEFQYIAQTAFQANEDRARVSTFYIVTLGSLVAALFSGQLDAVSSSFDINLGFAILFFAVSLFGLLTLLQLARLRQAWRESALAMNQIKRFYVEHYPDLPLNDALRWHNDNLPALYKPWSIGFMQMLQVAILSGVTLGTGVLFFSFMAGAGNWNLAIPTGLLFAALQVALYWWLLRKP